MRVAKVFTSVVVIGLLSAGGAALFGAGARAQEFPSRTITIIVPTAAGSGTDIFGRLIGQRLAAALGRTVIVDNRSGASGNIGAEAVVRAAPDGHTILYADYIEPLGPGRPPIASRAQPEGTAGAGQSQPRVPYVR